LIEDHNDLKQK